MSYRSDRFNDTMPSLDRFVDGFDDPSKIATLSDRGKSAASMCDALDPTENDAPDRDQELAGAILRLVIAGKGHLVPTLLLIAENGDNREKSLATMPRRSYFRHRDALLDFFVAL